MKQVYILIFVIKNQARLIYPMAFDSMRDAVHLKYNLYHSQIGNWYIIPLKVYTNTLTNDSRERVKTYTKF